MTTYVELATVPSADTPQTCVHVRHERGHYIFGRVAEGTQRALNARRISFAGTSHIFLSGPVGWGQNGGLVGLMLSMGAATGAATASSVAANADRGKRGLASKEVAAHAGIGLHAGDNISHVLACSRGFIFRQPLHVRLHEFQDRDDTRASDDAATTATPTTLDKREPDWQDEQIRVWKIPVVRARSSSPPKRRRSSSRSRGSSEEAASRDLARDQQQRDGHELAKFIVEEGLFNGKVGKERALVETTVGALEPNEAALVKGPGGIFRPYHPSSDGKQSLGRDVKAWRIDPNPTGNNKESFLLKRLTLPRTSYSATSMSYIMKTHDRRGKFDRAAAEALGVEKRDFKILAQGDIIQTKDGKTVTPDMVMGAPVPGTGIIVADIESHEFLESFMDRPEWKTPELMANITLMYWLLGPDMSSNAQIQKFISDNPSIRHVLCAPDTCPNMLTMNTASELQVKLRRVDPDRFPVPDYDNRVKIQAPAPDSNVEFGRASKRVQIMPRVISDDAHTAPFPDLVNAANAGWDEELETLTKAARAKASDPELLTQIEESEKDIPNRDAEITCLGTGSSSPSKYRNVSGTLIRVPGIGSYLLDAGEGTLGQIARRYGSETTTEILRDVRCVVISHLHADHHLGAPSIFKAWYTQALQDGSKAKLAVACNPRYREYLAEISQVEDFGFHRLIFPCQPPGTDAGGAVDVAVATAPFFKGTRAGAGAEVGQEDDFGLKAIKRIPVPHCWRAMATELELTSGLRIAYSGDCRPSKAFSSECRGAHLLIHECTFGDDMVAHAQAKNHCTVSEALRVAADMGARRTLLTHFSQRYVKAEALRLDEGQKGRVLMGFDFMTVRLGDFAKAACYLPAVEKVMEKMMDKDGPSEGGDA